MSIQGHVEELGSERDHVAELYERLDAERARVRGRYEAALGDDDVSPMERDVAVRASARGMKRLDVADSGLCFGRLDSLADERTYVGRIGLHDEDDEPVLLDWRAPASRPFYTATGAHPEGMRRRRQFHSAGRRVVDFTDELLGHPDAGVDPGADTALLAAVNAPRGEGMRDIVATIQAEQDAVIRLENPGVTVIEGGPGTGKTVVALHRVAYLLYVHRERIERHGVLVVGPNPSFLHHIGRVLPSLGESDVLFTTTGGLVPGLEVTAEDVPEVARAKGSRRMLEVLAAAIADRQRLLEQPIEIALPEVVVRIDGETVQWAREEARGSGRPHNEARAVFIEIVTYVLTERAIGRLAQGWLTRADRASWEELRQELLGELAESSAFTAVLDRLWPVLAPETLLASLYASPERLRAAGADPALLRAEGEGWTVSDVPLLDELVDLLGPDPRAKAPEAAREQERVEAEYAADVMDQLTLDHEEVDEDIGLGAGDLLDAGELAERFVEQDMRGLVERAAADRDWTFRHVVVDEAQELSAMDWRVLMRRCPARSFTVVGDLAQRRSAAGATSWAEMLETYVPGRWVHRSLSVNYRTPAEIMQVAAAVLAEFAPDVRPPESVRASGVRPWSRQVTDDELPGAVAEFDRAEAGREGTSVVVGPRGTPGAVSPSETKGLEFDAVLVVDPDRILDEGPRGAAELYVALTRATQRLGVLHRAPLPRALSALQDVGSTRPRD